MKKEKHQKLITHNFNHIYLIELIVTEKQEDR